MKFHFHCFNWNFGSLSMAAEIDFNPNMIFPTFLINLTFPFLPLTMRVNECVWELQDLLAVAGLAGCCRVLHGCVLQAWDRLLVSAVFAVGYDWWDLLQFLWPHCEHFSLWQLIHGLKRVTSSLLINLLVFVFYSKSIKIVFVIVAGSPFWAHVHTWAVPLWDCLASATVLGGLAPGS